MSKSIKFNGKILSRYNEIISNEALEFVQELHHQFNNRRLENKPPNTFWNTFVKNN